MKKGHVRTKTPRAVKTGWSGNPPGSHARKARKAYADNVKTRKQQSYKSR